MISSPSMIGQSSDPAEPGLPEPADVAPVPGAVPATPTPLDPTRFGDWEKNGRCIDF